MEQVMVDGRLERWFHDLRDIQDGDDDEEDEEEEAIDDVLCETDNEKDDEICINVLRVLQGRRGQSSEDDQRFFSISDKYNKYELPLPENNPPQENLDKVKNFRGAKIDLGKCFGAGGVPQRVRDYLKSEDEKDLKKALEGIFEEEESDDDDTFNDS
mmetsp:Transcript_64085/g.75873  ORF Transcript_64085/g.75873 Transcript_64085/m.75873 type:complete len:157 (+) Transcript_64085:795-1265(+)